jgi:formylglycine-generating enzyme
VLFINIMLIFLLISQAYADTSAVEKFCARFNTQCDMMHCSMSPVTAQVIDTFETQIAALEAELYNHLGSESANRRASLLQELSEIKGARDLALQSLQTTKDIIAISPDKTQRISALEKELSELQGKLVQNPKYKRAIDEITIVRDRLRHLKAGLSPRGVLTVPAGSFKMGENNDIPVTLRAFMVAQTHVTQGEWKQLSGEESPSRFKGDDRPVEKGSWASVVMYTIKLNEKLGLESPVDLSQMDATKWSGRWEDGTLSFNGDESNIRIDTSKSGYRLPTEAEYEYMQRNLGTTDGDYPHNLTHAELKDYFVFDERTTAEVKSKKPLLLDGREIYDLGGNVNHWLLDGYNDNLKGGDNPVQHPGGGTRVFRGGSWISVAQPLRSASRDGLTADFRNHSLGLRLVRTLP